MTIALSILLVAVVKELMTIALSILLVAVVAVLGFAVLPFVSSMLLLPIDLVVGFLSIWLSYMVSRYSSLAFSIAILIWLINFAGTKFDLVTWPAWIVAGWSMFTAGNTLIFFDISCYLGDRGAWAPSPLKTAEP
jgi:hypothetical protein